MSPMLPAPAWRAKVLFGALAVGASLLGLRLVELQVGLGDELSRKARQNTQERLEIPGPRGEIVDRHGRILALSVPGHVLAARPVDISRAGLVALERAAGRPGRLTRRAKRETWIDVSFRCDEACARTVRKLVADGVVPANKVHLSPSYFRHYPHGSVAAHVLGFINRENQAEGAEAAFDDALSSATRQLLLIEDAKRRVLETRLSEEVGTPPRAVMLSLDLRLQETLEAALRKAVKQHAAQGAQGIVLDPATGEILAMAGTPSFDPNRYWAYRAHYAGDVARTSFEPGSVVKPLTAAAILESQLYRPGATVDCEQGRWHFSGLGRPISDSHEHGRLTLPEVIEVSSNIGIAKFSRPLPAEALETWLRRFGFGQRTGIDLPAEQAGYVLPHTRWKTRDRFAVSYGYAVRTTVLQLAVAYAALANGGLRVEPHVGRALSGPRGTWEPIEHSAPERILRAGTSETLRTWLSRVVQGENGTGYRAAIAGYEVAGKTGTAEKYIAGQGYDRRRNRATFAGFAPADAPRAVIVISVDEPRESGRDGGAAAAPAFAHVMRETLRLLRTAAHPELRRAAAETQDTRIDG